MGARRRDPVATNKENNASLRVRRLFKMRSPSLRRDFFALAVLLFAALLLRLLGLLFLCHINMLLEC